MSSFVLKIKLTHLCFADDILILTDGSVGAPKETLETFQCFYNLSSIKSDPTKTAMYTSGVSGATLG